LQIFLLDEGDFFEESIKKVNLEKFIKYLIKFPSKAVIKRAGYLLENFGYSDKQIQKLKDRAS